MTTFLPASTDESEIRWLARLAADFGSRGSYQEYARWLEPRDAEKTAYLRAIESAFFDKRDLSAFPPPDADREAWCNAIGQRLLSGVLELNLLPSSPSIFKWTRSIVGIETVPTEDESSIPVGTSKFGGHPDVHGGFEWPTSEFRPMRFLGQIAFHDIRHSLATARYGLPKDGLLLLFANDDDESGMQPGMEGDWKETGGLTRAIFMPGGTQLQHRAPEVELGEFNAIRPCCDLRMIDALDLPVVDDSEDPELIAANGDDWLTENTSPGKDWTGLLTLDSDENLDWNWCDGEHLDFYVHRESIADGTFSKVYGYAA